MTESASTPRLRATFAIYLGLVVATAVWGPRQIGATAWYATGITGFLCVALACLGRLWSSVFIAGHKDESLVTTGPYARLRHPLYACSVLGALGLGLTSRSILLCAAAVVLIAGLVVYAAACEEQFLAEQFPDEFQRYCAAVPRKWWPGSRAAPLPERVEVRPAVYRKAFLDAASFFVLWLLVALAAHLRVSARHDAGEAETRGARSGRAADQRTADTGGYETGIARVCRAPLLSISRPS
jgi:protein-S-isoprenylcysteine O-methyltransferase Ste14